CYRDWSSDVCSSDLNDMLAYASACNGELVQAERRTALFPHLDLVDRLLARDQFVLQKTAENSAGIGRPELNGKAIQVGFYDMARSEERRAGEVGQER